MSYILGVILFALSLSPQESGKQENLSEKAGFPPLQTCTPDKFVPVSLHAEKVTARTVLRGESLFVELQTSGRSMGVKLPSEMAQINSLSLSKSLKLVVIGMVNGSGSEVVTIAADSGKLLDKFLCYFPVISPDGRWIAFAKF